MRVFVLDRNQKTLNPCCPARARKLLKSGRAKVFRRFPFTIILQDIANLNELCKYIVFFQPRSIEQFHLKEKLEQAFKAKDGWVSGFGAYPFY